MIRIKKKLYKSYNGMHLVQNVMNLNKDEDIVTLAMQDVTASKRPTHR